MQRHHGAQQHMAYVWAVQAKTSNLPHLRMAMAQAEAPALHRPSQAPARVGCLRGGLPCRVAPLHAPVGTHGHNT